MENPHNASLLELSGALHAGQVSSVALAEAFLQRIRQQDTVLNSFITVAENEVRAQAAAADDRLRAGQATRLTGIPIAHKDIFCTKGLKTTCGSRMLRDFVAPYDATIVERLNRAGMVTLGKTNMDEFAMGSSNENSHFGPVRNPWDTQRVPGGSSGGSATAVAARLAPVATGTDTGGSIRQPAAFCGVTGLKPSYGRVSRYGMVAFASSLDQGGLIAASAADIALVLEEMAGFDERDSTSIDHPVDAYFSLLGQSIEGLRIGVAVEHFAQGVEPAVEQAIKDAISVLEGRGAKVREIRLPHTNLSVPAYYVVAPAEASSNLARYDGVRFGHRATDNQDLEDMYKRSRAQGFGDEVKRRIMVGTYALSAGYYDAYYLKAQQIRRLISKDFEQAFEDVDVIVGPTSPTVAFKIGEKTQDPVAMYLSDIFTIGVSLAGLPAMSLPAGFVDGLPVGLQIVGKYFHEGMLLNLGDQYQQVSDWHRRKPALSS